MSSRKYLFKTVFAAIFFAGSYSIAAAQTAVSPASTQAPTTIEVTLSPEPTQVAKPTPPADKNVTSTTGKTPPTQHPAGEKSGPNWETILGILGIIALLVGLMKITAPRQQPYNYEYDRPRGRTLSDRERRELRDEYAQYRPSRDDDEYYTNFERRTSAPSHYEQPYIQDEDSMEPRYQRQSQATLILPTSKDKKTFADVAGQPEAIARLKEICQWLKHPAVYDRHNAKLPRGILFVGPPGTGKTLCAQALAGETHGSMFTMAASGFVELYVGVGASRVRALFADAKAQRRQTKKPVIIFIDELDAVGGARNQGLNPNSEREQTLNQLLVEMDGFTKNEGIIVIAATNRPDILDPALRRKGRFDCEVQVDLPDVNGREAILAVHTRGKTLAEGVDLKLMARRTFGMSGADLEAASNEAAVIAAREQTRLEEAELAAPAQVEAAQPAGDTTVTVPAVVKQSVIGKITPITLEMFDEAISIVESGDARRERLQTMTVEEKKQTAYHELGHAVVIHKTGGDPITKITILPRGKALGYVQTHTEGNRFNMTESDMRKRITAAMAGRIAQEIFMQTVDTGAASDFEQANRLARKMVTQFGMSPLGAIYIPDNSAMAIGPALTDRIDDEVQKIVAACAGEARSIIEANRREIEALVDLLLEKETIFGADFVAVFTEAGEKIAQEPKSPDNQG